MRTTLARAAFLVTATVMAACAQQVRVSQRQPPPPEQMAELWQAPDDIATRDLFGGTGGQESAPGDGIAYTWISTDTTGYSPGFEVRGPDGRLWSVKLGPEAQTEVVASRVLWAMGYHQPPTYYVSNWQLTGGPGGPQQPARFRLESPDAEVIGDWSWGENDFIGTEPFHGLIVANVLINSWDWKASNNKIYRMKTGTSPPRRFVVRDLGASFGKTTPSRLLWILPIPTRGFGQGSRNNIDDFESQRLIRRVDENEVRFDFHTIYGSVVDLVRPSDVRWTADLLSRLSDDQLDAAFRAGGVAPETRARFVRKMKAKIAEGRSVS